MQDRIGARSESAALRMTAASTRDDVFIAFHAGATGDLLYDVAHRELERIAYREKMGTVFRDRLAVAYESGVLAVFNVADGTLVRFYQDRAALWQTAEVDGRLLVATDEGVLLLFDESIWG